MSIKKDKKLHIKAYSDFRWYLDTTYSAKGLNKVVGLSAGYPAAGEFPLPNVILDKLRPFKNGKEKPRPGYGWEAGSGPLRRAILEFENSLHATDYKENNICMVAGASYGLSRIVEYLFSGKNDKDKKLLVISPTFYRMLNRASDYASIVSIQAQEKNDFQISAEEIIASLDKNVKAVFLLNPSNPTYLYYTDEFFNKIIPVLKKMDIYLIIDESGDAFYFDGSQDRLKKFPSLIGSNNVIRIVTASKKYLFAEYRIGYVLGGSKFMGNKKKGFIKLIGDDISNAPLAANEAWEEIVRHEILHLRGEKCQDKNCDFEDVIKKNNILMDQLRNYTAKRLRKSHKIKNIIIPKTNFNICFNIVNTPWKTDKELYQALLLETKISLLPCSGLGIPADKMYFRLTYGLNKVVLSKNLNKFLKFIEK